MDAHGTGASVPPDLVGDLVIDVASLGYSIGEAIAEDDGERPELIRPDLVALVQAFEQRGIAVRSVHVALPLIPVRIGPDANEQRARLWAEQWASWAHEEASRLADHRGISLETLAGAIDGRGEVGVDEQVVWAALDLAALIADDGDLATEVVVVVSSDSDLWHLAEYAAPARLFIAGRFTPGRCDTLLRRGTPFLRLSDDALRCLAPSRTFPPHSVRRGRAADLLPAATVRRGLEPDDEVVVEDLPGGGTFLGSSSLQPASVAAVRADDGVLANARTVAVVDAYGIFLAVRRAIGVAELPDARQVRDLLALLGWDLPAATLFVLPDLSEYHASRSRLPDKLRAAWRRRDGDFDDLAGDIASDHDVLTQARRSELRPEDSDVTLKRMSTGLVAELWRAHRHAPDADLVILTEDPDVCWLLQNPPESARAWPSITRVGVHPNRVEILGRGPIDGLGSPGQVVVLTEYLAAQLAGVIDHPFGRPLRDRLAGVVGRSVRVVPEGIDPETGGMEVSILDSARGLDGSPSGSMAEAFVGAIRTLIHGVGGGSVAPALLAEVESLGALPPVELHFDPRRTCSVPRLVVGSVAEDAEPTREATVVFREGYQLWVDLDFDGIADVAVPTGHDTTRYRVDDRVVVARVGVGGSWAVHDPGPAGGLPIDAAPQVLVVESIGDGGGWARDLETGRRGWVEPLPGEPSLRLARHILAVRLNEESNGTDEWLAVSSGLNHLDRMLADRE
jgi:hypothetical protein